MRPVSLPLHYSSEPGTSREKEERSERRLRQETRRQGCAYSVIRILTVSTIVFGVVAHKLTPPPPPVKLTQGCPPDLHHSKALKAVQLACKQQPSTVVAAFEGVEDALTQCRDRMKFQHWDCTDAGNILHDPVLLRHGYRESALVWALSAAGAAWGVATACAQGWIPDCSCNQEGQPNFEFGGCSYGVQHGITMSRKLLTKPTVVKSPLRVVEKHNLKAGRLAVKKTLISSCRCHGVSGSCQQRTCWKKTANLDHISQYLVEKYAKARMFVDEASSKNADLVYNEPSPDPCLIRKGGPPRVCSWRNETHSQGDCDRLCCGRGFSVTHEVIHYKCDCKFVWCCNLVCKDCLQHRWSCLVYYLLLRSLLMVDEDRAKVANFVDRVLGVNDQKNMSLTYAVSAEELIEMTRRAQEIVKRQPVMVEVHAPMKVCGDVHGQYGDLLRLWNKCGYPSDHPYLFLGDYVDRGRQQLEVISVLIGFKVAMPNSFFLLRGNHETSSINRTYGFLDECNRRYPKNPRLYDTFQEFFNYLPLCALIGGRIFCMHGGISPQLKSWEQLDDSVIIRPMEPSSRSLASDLLWSDPDTAVSGWAKSGRGVSFIFGEDVVREFCSRMDIDLIVRGHQVVLDGYEFFADRHLVTIFSAPRYCGEFENAAAAMNVSADMVVSFTVIKPRSKPPKFISAKRINSKTGN